MKKRKVIHVNNLPTRLPTTLTWLVVLTFSIYEIDKILLGAICAVLVIWWIVVLYSFFNQNPIKILDNEQN